MLPCFVNPCVHLLMGWGLAQGRLQFGLDHAEGALGLLLCLIEIGLVAEYDDGAERNI